MKAETAVKVVKASVALGSTIGAGITAAYIRKKVREELLDSIEDESAQAFCDACVGLFVDGSLTAIDLIAIDSLCKSIDGYVMLGKAVKAAVKAA